MTEQQKNFTFKIGTQIGINYSSFSVMMYKNNSKRVNRLNEMIVEELKRLEND